MKELDLVETWTWLFVPHGDQIDLTEWTLCRPPGRGGGGEISGSFSGGEGLGSSSEGFLAFR